MIRTIVSQPEHTGKRRERKENETRGEGRVKEERRLHKMSLREV